jgi:hypothetical protein
MVFNKVTSSCFSFLGVIIVVENSVYCVSYFHNWYIGIHIFNIKRTEFCSSVYLYVFKIMNKVSSFEYCTYWVVIIYILIVWLYVLLIYILGYLSNWQLVKLVFVLYVVLWCHVCVELLGSCYCISIWFVYYYCCWCYYLCFSVVCLWYRVVIL